MLWQLEIHDQGFCKFIFWWEPSSWLINGHHLDCMHQLLSCVWLFVTPQTVNARLCRWDFFRQEYWSGLPFSFSRGLPHAGIKPMSPVSYALQVGSLPTEPSGKPKASILLCACGTSLLHTGREKNRKRERQREFFGVFSCKNTVRSYLGII